MKPGISLLLCAVVTLLASRPAHAVGRLADLSVVDRTNGAVLPVYYAHGTYWIAGTPGRRYGLLIRNALGERVLAVASVDGINVLSGAPAAVDQVGYVLGPRERYEIDGWRKSDNEVAAFEFVASPQSYAERTGRASNVGVVGVAVFRERPEPPPSLAPSPSIDGYASDAARAPTSGTARREAAASPPAEPAAGASVTPRLAEAPKLGTGHGERETSVVGHTDFERLSDRPDEVLRVRFDSYEHLVAMGVIRQPAPRLPQPDAFPGSAMLGYVPDPPR